MLPGLAFLDVADLDPQRRQQTLVGVGGEDRPVVRDDALWPPVGGEGGTEQLQDGDHILIARGHARQALARVALNEAEAVCPLLDWCALPVLALLGLVLPRGPVAEIAQAPPHQVADS